MRIHSKSLLLSTLVPVLVSARKDVHHDINQTSKTTRIIGGDEAEDGRYPYTVSVQMGGSHYCGGSLIAKDIVLTAAHCLSLASFQVVIGRTDISDANNGDQIAVKKMILHPDFDIDGTWESDFALLVLARPTTSTNAQVMELNMDDNYPSSGTIGTVMGWGDIKEQNNKFETSDVLMTVEAETLSNEECASAQGKLDGFKGTYEDWIFPSMICTLSKKQNACNGDSGGPLVVLGEDSTKDVQIGVVSWSMPAGCATKVFPVVYSRISSGIDWFKQHVCNLSSEPPGSLCGTPEPTGAPTKSPTESPSESPMVPTMTPTDYPTVQPSSTPTAFPTTEPSQTPTMQPTTAPSFTPTVSPTFSPTELPSSIPSYLPSLGPSISIQPSHRPSTVPSISPTDSPSTEPSISVQPSLQPTALPSLSSQPTLGPTTSPTISVAPTIKFSNAPSLSTSPTLSLAPTLSTAPSEIPSISPSVTQSPSSSSMPTAAPSFQPTATPTQSHSPTLSMLPSQTLTSSPTTESHLNAISRESENGTSLVQVHIATMLIMTVFLSWALV